VTSDPNDPNRAFEYPSLEQSGVPVDRYAPIDYPPTYPSVPPAYPPSPQGYPSPFPPPSQPRYGTDPYYPYRVGHPQGTNGQAIGALVTAIVGVPLCFCVIPSIAAVILGIVAMNETRRTGQDGHGMALAAVVIGGITLAIAVVIWIASALTPNAP
jgi:Domain of unknown function (DUF4190)